jgi:hypothetical protein
METRNAYALFSLLTGILISSRAVEYIDANHSEMWKGFLTIVSHVPYASAQMMVVLPWMPQRGIIDLHSAHCVTLSIVKSASKMYFILVVFSVKRI